MRFYRKGSFSFWVNILLLSVLLIAIVKSFSYSDRARLVPLIVTIPTLILVIFMLIGEKYPKLTRRFDISLSDLARGVSEREPWSEAVSEQGVTKRVLLVCAWMAGFFILIYSVGFLIGIPLSILLFLKIYERIHWLKALVATIITWGFIYGMFNILMKVDLFQGILFGAIAPPI